MVLQDLKSLYDKWNLSPKHRHQSFEALRLLILLASIHADSGRSETCFCRCVSYCPLGSQSLQNFKRLKKKRTQKIGMLSKGILLPEWLWKNWPWKHSSEVKMAGSYNLILYFELSPTTQEKGKGNLRL